jgi:DNA-binding NarL/FixJ family response regulator
MPPIRLMLVDDHALFRGGVASLLAACPDIEVVGEAGSGAEALAMLPALSADLVLMDVQMPGMDGLEATRRIRAGHPAVKVVMLTVSEEDRALFEAVKAGARGYLLKKLEPEEFLEMLRGLSRGEAAISRAMAAKILGEFARRGQASPPGNSPAPLTARERDVLQLLAQGRTNKEIATALDVSENTVKTHLKHILAKLQLENRVQAVTFALREGLVPESPRRP